MRVEKLTGKPPTKDIGSISRKAVTVPLIYIIKLGPTAEWYGWSVVEGASIGPQYLPARCQKFELNSLLSYLCTFQGDVGLGSLK